VPWRRNVKPREKEFDHVTLLSPSTVLLNFVVHVFRMWREEHGLTDSLMVHIPSEPKGEREIRRMVDLMHRDERKEKNVSI
jgi:hypothetical protein